MLNFGVIGTGAIAADFCTALQGADRVRVVNVCGSSADKAATFAERFAIPRSAADLDALLRDPQVAAVYIATPHPLHAPQALAAIAAGRHVLCEKPMTLDATTTAALIAAAAQHRVLLMEAFMYRCHPLIAEVIAQVQRGVIGRLRHIRADFGFQAPRQDGHRLFDAALGGGAILDVGGYPMSFARLFAGVAIAAPFAEPVTLDAHCQRGPTGVDELAIALLRFESGLSAELGCAIRHRLGSSATLFGDHGRIHLPDPWLPGGQRQGLVSSYMIQRDGTAEETVTVAAERPSYAIEADVFAAALPSRQLPWPVMDAADSLGNARALDRWRQAVA